MTGEEDLTKVDEFRIREVLNSSQATYDRIWKSESGMWVMKRGRDGNFNIPVARAVREAIARGLAYEESNINRLRPTKEGYRYLFDLGLLVDTITFSSERLMEW